MAGEDRRDIGIDGRLELLGKSLAATGEGLRDGSFRPEILPGAERGCADGRPSFATEPPREEDGPSSFTIVTPHAGEACAFVEHVYRLFWPFLDECIEQDFFDRLTQAAVEYSCYVDPSDATAVNLMKVLHAEAEEIAEEMRTGEFPYASSRR